MPRFSIIVPTYNRPQMLRKALMAICAQEFKDWECLVVDGSEENYSNVVPKDPRILHMHLPGMSFADRWKHAYAVSSGEIFNFQADDDQMRPCALGVMDDLFRSTGAMWAYGRIKIPSNDHGFPAGEYGDKWTAGRLRFGNYLPCPAVFWTRAAYERTGNWDEAVLEAHDWDYWLRLGAQWDPAYSERVLVDYNIHDQQASVVRLAQIRKTAAKINARALDGYYEYFAESLAALGA